MKKCQRVIVVATANAIAEQHVIVVGIANLIAHSKVKIPYPRTQKARGNNLLGRILFPEFHFHKAELTHKTLHISSSTAQKFGNTINQLKYRIRLCTT